MIDIVSNTINRYPLGYVFTTGSIAMAVENANEVNRVLNILLRDGLLRRLSKGRFYKPIITRFGELKPDVYQTVKDLLKKDGRIIGYITGYTIFNQLALTTQVPAVLQIGTPREKKIITRGFSRIGFIKQENTITKQVIPLLQLLDCLRLFNSIPDTAPDTACRRLLYLFLELSSDDIEKTKRLALKYNPATIALLGAILETINTNEDCKMLSKAINRLSYYKLSISDSVLPNKSRWNIK